MLACTAQRKNYDTFVKTDSNGAFSACQSFSRFICKAYLIAREKIFREYAHGWRVLTINSKQLGTAVKPFSFRSCSGVSSTVEIMIQLDGAPNIGRSCLAPYTLLIIWGILQKMTKNREHFSVFLMDRKQRAYGNVLNAFSKKDVSLLTNFTHFSFVLAIRIKKI